MSEQEKLPLGIMELRIKNILGIEAAYITPTGEVTLITGANAQGKSSAVNSIFLGLTGKAPGVEEPIRHGAKHAEITIGLGTTNEMKVEVIRRFELGKSPSVTVKPIGGKALGSPQKLLNTLFDSTTIDPSEFKGLDDKAQATRLMKAMGVDVDAIHAAREKIFEARKEANREVKRLRAVGDSLPPAPPKDTPDEPVSVVELLKKQEELRGIRDAHERALGERAAVQRDITDKKREVSDAAQLVETLKEKLAAAEGALASAEGEQDKLAAALASWTPPSIPDPNAEKAIQDSLANVETVNANVQMKLARQKVITEYKAANQTASRLDGQLTEFDEKQVRDVGAAMEKIPVNGLTVNEDGIFVNEVPLNQCSTMEQWVTWTRIAMAQKPKLRVIMIRGGSDMDRKTDQAMKRLAAEEKYWLWIEKVMDEPGQEGIHFEDGAVVAVNGERIIDPEEDAEAEAEAEEFDLFNKTGGEEGGES